MKSRLIILGVFCGCLVLIVVIGAYRISQVPDVSGVAEVEPMLVRAIQLESRPYMLTETFYGLIEADVRVDMSFQVEGRVIAMGLEAWDPLEENDLVKRGDVLSKIEPTIYRAQWEQALGQLNEARAAQGLADALIDDAQAKLDDAALEAERLRKLLASASTNQREWERADTTRKVAEAAKQSAMAQRDSANARYESGRAALDLAAERLTFTTLLSPMMGRVAWVNAEVGQMVMPTDTVMTLVDTRRVRLVLGVVERKVALLQVGQGVEVVIDALDAVARRVGGNGSLSKFVGRVAIIPPSADLVSGLFNVEVVIDNPNHILRPGMVARAKVDVVECDVVALPAAAVFRIGQSYFAYFVLNDPSDSAGSKGMSTRLVARRRVINPMAIDHDDYLLRELPWPKAQLIVEGHMRLSDGYPVRLSKAGSSQVGELSKTSKSKE